MYQKPGKSVDSQYVRITNVIDIFEYSVSCLKLFKVQLFIHSVKDVKVCYCA